MANLDPTTAELAAIINRPDPPDWLERPRGHACPECHAHIGYSPHHDADKTLHREWHSRQERLFGKILQALELGGQAFDVITELIAPEPEPP